MKYLAAFLLVLGAVATCACGGGEYKAPPKGNDLKPANIQNPGSGGGGKKPTGPSMAKEYEAEMKAAFAAHKEYEEVKRDSEARKEPYITWAEHLYAALAYSNVHAKNGHSKEDLPRFTELKELKSGYFKNALGPSEDPRVKQAIKKWQESTN